VKRGLFIAPFDELVDPRVLMDVAQRAEARGWDGLFLWDHIRYREPVNAVADPWIGLSAIATVTKKLRIGPLVTPLARRRVQKLARETVTLDHLSDGRLVLGVGLGSDTSGELEPFGEELDPRKRAAMLDERLERLSELWGGEFEPQPVQQPRIPVWVAGRYPNRRPLRRAARWDGFFPIEMPGPEALAEMRDQLDDMRADGAAEFDLIVEIDPGDDPGPWAEAGATWVLTDFGRQPRVDEVRATIDAGP
jgi:alkanesulfonate monooxygenase SsuD/methylene tetrahydromethanopterin reductase-like flavin-dependent oxidoreductase (luciferase family)